MATKRYRCKLPNDDEVTFVVDTDVLTEDEAHGINNFWSDSEQRLRDAQGNVVVAVLRLACLTVLGLMRREGAEFIGDDDAALWNIDFHEEEGWFGCGIVIEEASRIPYQSEEVEVEAL